MRALVSASPLALLALLASGCPAESPEPSDTGAAETETESTETADSESTETSDSESTESSDSESTETETETETGEPCTGETCSSTLTLSFAHSLPLLDGPHLFHVTLPNHDLLCSVEASPSGRKSCFGFAFADLSWDEASVTVFLTNPFFDVDLNPEAEPFQAAQVEVERGGMLVFAGEVSIEAGESSQPDPCGPTCWHSAGALTIE